MSPRDAFGREIGDDPIEDMGWDGRAAAPEQAPLAQAPPAPAPPAPAPPAPAPPAPAPPAQAASYPLVLPPQLPRHEDLPASPMAPAAPRRRRRGGGAAFAGIGATVILLVIVGGIAAAVFALDGAKDTLVDKVVTSVTPKGTVVTSEPSGADEPARPAGPPRGLARGSLARPAELRDALARLRRIGGSRAQYVRLAPERVDATLISPSGRRTIAQVRWDGGRSIVRTPATGGTQPTVALTAVDTKVPARIIRRAAKVLGKRVSSWDYAVLLELPIEGRDRWTVYFTGGRGVLFDARGRLLQRIG